MYSPKIITRLSTTALIGAALAFAPALINADNGPLSSDALAQGKSEGKGKSGENGNKGGNGQGSERSSAKGDNRSERGKEASSLKRLNAANSSMTAQENASMDSVVGKLGGYRDAVEDSDFEQAAMLLEDAAGGSVSGDQAALVNDRMGIELTDEQEAELIEFLDAQ